MLRFFAAASHLQLTLNCCSAQHHPQNQAVAVEPLQPQARPCRLWRQPSRLGHICCLAGRPRLAQQCQRQRRGVAAASQPVAIEHGARQRGRHAARQRLGRWQVVRWTADVRDWPRRSKLLPRHASTRCPAPAIPGVLVRWSAAGVLWRRVPAPAGARAFVWSEHAEAQLVAVCLPVVSLPLGPRHLHARSLLVSFFTYATISSQYTQYVAVQLDGTLPSSFRYFFSASFEIALFFRISCCTDLLKERNADLRMRCGNK